MTYLLLALGSPMLLNGAEPLVDGGSDGLETPTQFAIVSFGALLSAEMGTEKRLRRSALRMRTLESGAA